MKRIFFSGLLSLSCALLFAQQGNGYEITGQVAGLAEGDKVLMTLIVANGYDDREEVRRDSAYVKNGQFHISGIVPDGPRVYIMDFIKQGKECWLMVDNNDKITITSAADINKIHHSILHNYLKIEGSRSTKTMMLFEQIENYYIQSINSLNRYLRKIKDSVGFDPSLVGGVVEAKNRINFTYYANYYNHPDFAHPDPDIIHYPAAMGTVVYGFKTLSGHSWLVKAVYDKLDEATKKSYFGMLLKDWTRLCVGEPFPPFNLPDIDGKMLSLDQVVAKSKVTLVHFWGKFSYEKKRFQDELRALYAQYHPKGLNVIGVCSDSIDYEWKGLVKAEKFPWYNVSDLKGREGIVRTVYHEFGASDCATPNTTNVLIDAQGKIIAWDVYGAELQWYLWKYLEADGGNASIKNK